MKIYLASSWRNVYQADVLASLRAAGHEVYDFKNPVPGDHGFSWRQIAPDIGPGMSAERLRSTLAHPVAQRGFGFDRGAMVDANACVLLLPSGMSAHLEAGWMAGRGKIVVVLAPEVREPELMYKLFDDADDSTPIFGDVDRVIEHLRSVG